MKLDTKLRFTAYEKIPSSGTSAFSIEEGDDFIDSVLANEQKKSRLKKYMLVISTLLAGILIGGVLVATYSDLGWQLFGAGDSHSDVLDNEIPTESSNAKKGSDVKATTFPDKPTKHEKGSHGKNRDDDNNGEDTVDKIDSNRTSDSPLLTDNTNDTENSDNNGEDTVDKIDSNRTSDSPLLTDNTNDTENSDNSNGEDTVANNTNDMENSVKNEENSIVNNISVSESSLGTWTENGINYEVIKEYPHDKTSYTQGLTYHNGRLFETTGKYSHSKVLELDPSTGNVLSSVDIPDTYFGEGVTYNAVNDTLVQVTWKERKGFIYNPNDFSVIRTFGYSTYKNQGWGITQDPISNELIVSDGTPFLYFWDPETLEEKRKFKVYGKNGKLVNHLDELEFVHGRVFANVWRKDYVVAIDPATGLVMEEYYFKDLFMSRPPGSHGLNAISITDKEDELFVTGKLWSSLFRVKIALPNN